MKLTKAERAEIIRQREISAMYAGLSQARQQREAADRERLAGPPPKGYGYHCKYCSGGTNDPAGICLGCRFY